MLFKICLFLLFQVRKVRVVKSINHGAKILNLRRPPNNPNWFYGLLRDSGLHDLVYMGYDTVPHAWFMTLCKRFKGMAVTLGEMTVTLDDVACLLHIPIEGRMLSHPKMSRTDGAVKWWDT